MRVMAGVASGLMAWVFVATADAFLPEMPRYWVLMLGGVLALTWSQFIDMPLKEWARSKPDQS